MADKVALMEIAMNSTNKTRPGPLQKTFLWGGVAIVLVSIFALMQHTVKASPPPLLAQATLEAEALTWAQRYGLQGSPMAPKAVQMSLGEWYALTNSELGKDAAQIGLTPDVPVFVLAIHGSIEWRGPSGAAWWGGGPEHYDNITVVLNARTGDLMWVGAKRAGFSMPVPVP
jgi:hypothetical protein